MLNGKVLYKDVFDHKGPFIFFIYVFGSLFRNINGGFYLIDVLIFNIAYYFQYKTIKIYSNKQTALLLILIELFMLLTTYRIVIPENIAFLCFSYINYWILSKKYINTTNCELILCGLLTGLLFWIKFSLCIYIFIIYVGFILKQWKLKNITYQLIGFSMPTIFVIMYSISNNAVYDLWFSYFIVNIGYKSSLLIIGARFLTLSVFVCFFLIYGICIKNMEISLISVAYGGLIVATFLMTGKQFPNYYLPFISAMPLVGCIIFTPCLFYEQHPNMWETIYSDIQNKRIEYLLVEYDAKKGILYHKFYKDSMTTVAHINKIITAIHKNYDIYNIYHNKAIFKRKTD